MKKQLLQWSALMAAGLISANVVFAVDIEEDKDYLFASMVDSMDCDPDVDYYCFPEDDDRWIVLDKNDVFCGATIGNDGPFGISINKKYIIEEGVNISCPASFEGAALTIAGFGNTVSLEENIINCAAPQTPFLLPLGNYNVASGATNTVGVHLFGGGNKLIGSRLEHNKDPGLAMIQGCDVAVQIDDQIPFNLLASFEAAEAEAKKQGIHFFGNIVERIEATNCVWGFNVQNNFNILTENNAECGPGVIFLSTPTNTTPVSGGYVVGNAALSGTPFFAGTATEVKRNLLDDNDADNNVLGFIGVNLLASNATIFDISNRFVNNHATHNQVGFFVGGTGHELGSRHDRDARNTAEFNTVTGISVAYLPAVPPAHSLPSSASFLDIKNIVAKNRTTDNNWGVFAGASVPFFGALNSYGTWFAQNFTDNNIASDIEDNNTTPTCSQDPTDLGTLNVYKFTFPRNNNAVPPCTHGKFF